MVLMEILWQKNFFLFFFWETWFLTISGGNRIPITVDNRDWIEICAISTDKDDKQ